MKIKYVALFLLLTIVIVAGFVFWMVQQNTPKIDCQGQFVWEINNELFRGDAAFQMLNNQGVVTLTGYLRTPENKKYNISRIVYFSYNIVRENYIIHTNNIVRFPTDDLQDGRGFRSVPPIYLFEDASFSLRIKAWREGWSFTTIGAPSLLCRKSG